VVGGLPEWHGSRRADGRGVGGFANALAVLHAWPEIRTSQGAWKTAWKTLVGSGGGSGHEGEEWRCSRKDWI
jgi:hypothetical protein